MSAPGTVVTFTNLFPSALQPTHGLFVAERMRRVAAVSGLPWTVVAPVPQVVWPLRWGSYRLAARQPAAERHQGIAVAHPRYRHWPGLSQRRQARAMARGARATVAALVAAGPIVLDAHYLWPDGVAAALLARELGVPYVLTARGSDLNVLAADPVVAAAIAAAAAGAFACAAVSGALADRFAAVAGLPRARVLEIRNGVDLERFCLGDRSAARAALGLPAAGQLLLGVGRLVAGKGFGLVAAALAELPAEVRLVLVGDGPERRALQAAGGDRVHWLGNRPPAEVALACQAADLLVLPSQREGWPNVVTEALACGLRVAASAVGGIPQILAADAAGAVDPRLGALLPPDDRSAWVAALRRLLQQPAEPPFVRAFASRYGWDEPVAVLVDVFRRALRSEAA